MNKTIKSLFYSTFYPFIPVDKRYLAEHCLAGGIIFWVGLLIIMTIFASIFVSLIK